MISSQTNREYTTFVPVRFATKVVAGTFYTIEYNVGNNDILRVEVFQPLPNSNELAKVTSHYTYSRSTGAMSGRVFSGVLASSAIALCSLLL
mmetsp:Transcript_12902/g.21822  ORF Transcript_12902/g.21822 Transcript_12902/m.21822 type:complete len:92 (-) Transcript_12902:47-322(-)